MGMSIDQKLSRLYMEVTNQLAERNYENVEIGWITEDGGINVRHRGGVFRLGIPEDSVMEELCSEPDVRKHQNTLSPGSYVIHVDNPIRKTFVDVTREKRLREVDYCGRFGQALKQQHQQSQFLGYDDPEEWARDVRALGRDPLNLD